jgi:MFS family permease
MSADATNNASPFGIRNVRRFIAFRIGFNARFYYPVFTILFLDFGLSLEQFAILNAVWAAAIVLLEVPSGALADTVGRRNLLVVAALLMVIEISVLCFVPLSDSRLVFTAFLVNRVLSGAAEAAASGADEALAYDSLKEAGDVRDWGRVLERQMRLQSLAYVGAMTVGAAVYDPKLWRWMADWTGWPLAFGQEATLRFPLYLTLVMSLMTLSAAVGMREVGAAARECSALEGCRRSIAQSLRLTLEAGRWILTTPYALVLITTGLLFDHVIRMVVTLNSRYYRQIDLPEASFGLIGSAMALAGLFIPRVALWLSEHRSPVANLMLTSALTFLGLAGMTFFVPVWGVLPMACLYAAMMIAGFLLSHYLNRITESHQRATVLSFKGLSYNLAYGGIGLLYSSLLVLLKSRTVIPQPDGSGELLEAAVFQASMGWFPWYFAVGLVLLLIFARRRLKGSEAHRKAG